MYEKEGININLSFVAALLSDLLLQKNESIPTDQSDSRIQQCCSTMLCTVQYFSCSYYSDTATIWLLF